MSNFADYDLRSRKNVVPGIIHPSLFGNNQEISASRGGIISGVPTPLWLQDNNENKKRKSREDSSSVIPIAINDLKNADIGIVQNGLGYDASTGRIVVPTPKSEIQVINPFADKSGYLPLVIVGLIIFFVLKRS